MAEYWLREPTQWRSLKHGTTAPIGGEPGVNPMYLGAASTGGTEANWLALEGLVGRMGVRRNYNPGLPSTAPAALIQDYGKRTSWYSVKADWAQMASGSLDATVTSLVNSVPANHELWLTFAHEPENDGVTPANGNNPAYNAWVAANAPTWRAACERFYDVVKAARPQTLVGPILMGFTFAASSGRNPNDWKVAANKCDFYGIDAYNPYLFPMVGSPSNWVNQPSNDMVAFTAFCNSLGCMKAVGETACHEDESGIGPQRKVDWINSMIAYAEANDYLAYCWFNSYKPGDTAPPMLLDSSPQTTATWSAQVVAHQRGIK